MPSSCSLRTASRRSRRSTRPARRRRACTCPSRACRSTSSRAPAEEFADGFQTDYLRAERIDPYAIYGGQSAQILLDAIEDSDGSRADVIAKMFATEVTDGLLGSFKFNENGDPADAEGAVVGFTIYVATDKLETAKAIRRSPRRSTRRPARKPAEYARDRAAGGRLPSRRFRFRVARHGVTRANGFAGLVVADRPDRAARSSALVSSGCSSTSSRSRREFLNVGIIGLTNGAIYGLVALGYTLVYGILQLINFAHGDVFALSGLVASTIIVSVLGLDTDSSVIVIIGGLLATLAVTMAVFALVNATIERVAYKPLRNAPRLAPLITAVGMSFIVQNVALAIYGVDFASVPELHPAHGRRRHRRRQSPVEQARRDPHRRAGAARPHLVRALDAPGEGDARGRPGPRGLGDDGDRRQPHDLGHVPDRRRARRRPPGSSTCSSSTCATTRASSSA